MEKQRSSSRHWLQVPEHNSIGTGAVSGIGWNWRNVPRRLFQAKKKLDKSSGWAVAYLFTTLPVWVSAVLDCGSNHGIDDPKT